MHMIVAKVEKPKREQRSRITVNKTKIKGKPLEN